MSILFYSSVAFVLGFLFGLGLMWYYWRRYKNTDTFKKEVEERALELVQSMKKQ